MEVNYVDLVARAKNGDKEAIADLYNATYKNACFLADNMVKNEQEALDIVQNSYINAFPALEHLLSQRVFLVG